MRLSALLMIISGLGGYLITRSGEHHMENTPSSSNGSAPVNAPSPTILIRCPDKGRPELVVNTKVYPLTMDQARMLLIQLFAVVV